MTTTRTRFAAAFTTIVALAALMVACAGSASSSGDNTYGTGPNTPGSTGNASVVINMKNNYFAPQVDTVAVGDTVTWTNAGTKNHTTTSDSTFWDSGSLAPGQSFTHVFTTAGTYPYHCTFHVSLGMTGTLVVK